jgi:hypothetical protein
MEVLEIVVDFGAEHLGRCMAATVVEAVKEALRRKYNSQLSMAAWRGYANLLLDKYVGINAQGVNMAQIKWQMIERADMGEMVGMCMEHETDVPMMDAFSYGWGDALN